MQSKQPAPRRFVAPRRVEPFAEQKLLSQIPEAPPVYESQQSEAPPPDVKPGGNAIDLDKLFALLRSDPITKEIEGFISKAKQLPFSSFPVSYLEKIPANLDVMFAWPLQRVESHHERWERSNNADFFLGEMIKDPDISGPRGRMNNRYPLVSSEYVLNSTNDRAFHIVLQTYDELIVLFSTGGAQPRSAYKESTFPVPGPVYALVQIFEACRGMLDSIYTDVSTVPLFLRAQAECVEWLELYVDRMAFYASKLLGTYKAEVAEYY